MKGEREGRGGDGAGSCKIKEDKDGEAGHRDTTGTEETQDTRTETEEPMKT